MKKLSAGLFALLLLPLCALLYCAMYRLTSNAYYRIVSTKNA